MPKTIDISISQKDARRDRRYRRPPLSLHIGEDERIVRDWSLGGFLMVASPNRKQKFEPGSRFDAMLSIAEGNQRFAVTAEIVRRGDPEGTVACRFVGPSPAMTSALETALRARMVSLRETSRASAKVGFEGVPVSGVLVLAVLAVLAGAIAARLL